MYIANQKEMQLLDQYTIEQLGLPGVVLMENAGEAVVQEIIKDYPFMETEILVLAGSGNNGGDGFVIARKLIDYGYKVNLCLAISPTRLKGDAKIHFEVYQNRQLPFFIYEENQKIFGTHLKNAEVIVDALLGTGASGMLRDPFFTIIQKVNASHKSVFAVDIPSGVNATTGEVDPFAIKARKTISFTFPKLGFFLGEGHNYIGDWKVVNISVPENTPEVLGLSLPKLIDEQIAYTALPKRRKDGHKGTFGHCLIIGGSINYVGAPIYSAKAAFHSGAGLVSLAIPEHIYPIVATQCSESLLLPLSDEYGVIKSDAVANLDFSKYKAIAFGPGIGRQVDGDRLLGHILSKLDSQSIVIDADGLYFFKRLLGKERNVESNIILTPHPGEMANLTGLSVAEVEKNRIEVATNFATTYGVYLLLKGHRSIVVTPKGKLWINPFGNDTLGRGGSGDVLTGLIVSFLSQGATPLEAMQAATFYHSTAAEKLGALHSNYGVTPTDVIDYLSKNL